MDNSARHQDLARMNEYIRYSSGPLSGRTVRSELQEYQKPDLGRKFVFAKRDRRPLDPPPVVRLRMWELLDEGLPTQRQEEIAADDIDISGLVAHIDLFPATPPPELQASSSGRLSTNTTDIRLLHPSQQQILPSSASTFYSTPSPLPPGSSLGASDIASTTPATQSLFGSSFVHAVHMDWRGEPVVFFVFADLSVRLEGYFRMRYRYFDLFSRTADSEDVPVAAELFSGIFVVYSTKEFPGLQASTPLTKHLSRWGVRVNLREGERRRKSDDSSGAEDTPSGGPKKKGRSAR